MPEPLPITTSAGGWPTADQRIGNSSVAFFSPQFLNHEAMMPDSIW